MNGQHLDDMILLSNLEHPQQEKELSFKDTLAYLLIIFFAAAIFILVAI